MPTLDWTLVVQQFTSIGGPVMGVLLLISVVALATTIGKTVEFARLGIGAHRNAQAALAAWEAGDRGTALDIVDNKRPALSQVTAETMRAVGLMPDETEFAKESGIALASAFLARLSRQLRMLETIVQAAPMLGLLGTVLGMIAAFGQLARSGGVGDPGQLAGGIWIALSTTAAGLAIAIPFYFAANWFEDRIERERVAMEAAIAKVVARTPKVYFKPAGRGLRPIEAAGADEDRDRDLRLG